MTHILSCFSDALWTVHEKIFRYHNWPGISRNSLAKKKAKAKCGSAIQGHLA